MKNKFLVGLVIGIVVGASISINPLAADKKTAEITNLPQNIMSVDVNKSFDFAGELMPNTFDARERMDRELSVNAYWQSSTLLNIKASKRYFPIMERILAEEGVPQDFKYLAVAESNLRHVTSPANAKGFWQFRKLAAKEMGLEVNDEVDERYHVEKSTKAACQYIKQLHRRFGNWTNAAAAYNVGPTNYKRILSNQGETDYYNLNINEETGRYLFRLMAFKEIMENPETYGYYVNSDQTYPPFDDTYNVVVDKSVDSWGEFAKARGISYRTLKIYNPWLRDNKLTVIKNTYNIKIPRNKNQ